MTAKTLIATLLIAMKSFMAHGNETLIRCDRQEGVGMDFYEWVVDLPSVCLRDNGSSFTCGRTNQLVTFGSASLSHVIKVEVGSNFYRFHWTLNEESFLWSQLDRDTAISQVIFDDNLATFGCYKIKSRPKL